MKVNLVGQKFGMLTVLCRVASRDSHNHCWRCECECGAQTEVFGFSLKSGNTKSCGNHQKGPITHGKSYSRAYTAWDHMMQRCGNKNHPNYKDYGARGITVCDKWKTFEGFYEDMRDPPPGLTLERRDNNAGYFKDNCRWTTRIDQSNNQRTSVFLTHDGITITLAQWRRRMGFKRGVIEGRLRLGWPVDKAISTPMKGRSL